MLLPIEVPGYLHVHPGMDDPYHTQTITLAHQLGFIDDL